MKIKELNGKDYLSLNMPKKIPVSYDQQEYINHILDDTPECSKQLYYWIFSQARKAGLRSEEDRRPIAISAKAMRENVPGALLKTERMWEPIPDNILHGDPDYTYYPNKYGKCRRFQIPQNILTKIISKGGEGDTYNLRTGKPLEGPAHQTNVKRDNGHYWRDPLGSALDVLSRCSSLVNKKAVENHLQDLEDKLEQYRIFDKPKEEIDSLQSRLNNDRTCWNTVLSQGLSPAENYPDGIYEYTPAYKVQKKSGRISEIGGGLQSCSRQMKEAARKVDDVHNYDIKSSQLNLLVQRMSDAELKHQPLLKFLEYDKEHFASKLGISRDNYKRLFYATLFGARVNESWSDATKDSNGKNLSAFPSIIKSISDDPESLYNRASNLLRPIQQCVQRFADYYLNEYFNKHSHTTCKGKYIKNESAVTFYPEQYEEGFERRSAALTHVLQGDEAALIHTITKKSENHRFSVIGNEHDGLITKNKINYEVVRKSKKTIGFERAEMTEKAIA